MKKLLLLSTAFVWTVATLAPLTSQAADPVRPSATGTGTGANNQGTGKGGDDTGKGGDDTGKGDGKRHRCKVDNIPLPPGVSYPNVAIVPIPYSGTGNPKVTFPIPNVAACAHLEPHAHGEVL